jgi:hypothetical protein
MHAVEQAATGWVRSKCRRPHPVRGVKSTVPRAEAYAEDWTAERLWYPDCPHCPGEESGGAPQPAPLDVGDGAAEECGCCELHEYDGDPDSDEPWCQVCNHSPEEHE